MSDAAEEEMIDELFQELKNTFILEVTENDASLNAYLPKVNVPPQRMAQILTMLTTGLLNEGIMKAMLDFAKKQDNEAVANYVGQIINEWLSIMHNDKPAIRPLMTFKERH